MPRAGLSTDIVVHEAADLADEIGYDALTLTALATRLNVAVPSLYKHVGGLDALRRQVALLAVEELGSAMRAAGGERRAARDDLRALAAAYRRYALEHPGRYAATVRAAPAGDVELLAASDAAVGVVLDALGTYGLAGDDLVHAARSLRAALHGFASLESAGGFGLPQDVERSFEWMVEAFEGGLLAR
ncbi:MAG: TetR/AcrR family transcriptional regulator [Candidatus Limnocylindrales bacterium]